MQIHLLKSGRNTHSGYILSICSCYSCQFVVFYYHQPVQSGFVYYFLVEHVRRSTKSTSLIVRLYHSSINIYARSQFNSSFTFAHSHRHTHIRFQFENTKHSKSSCLRNYNFLLNFKFQFSRNNNRQFTSSCHFLILHSTYYSNDGYCRRRRIIIANECICCRYLSTAVDVVHS